MRGWGRVRFNEAALAYEACALLDRARRDDAGGRFGGALMRQHHRADPRRFIQVEDLEVGYGRILVSQLSNPNSLVMVAERSGNVVGARAGAPLPHSVPAGGREEAPAARVERARPPC